MKLTDTKVKKLKPAEKPRRYTDGGGMYLEVRANGSKLWRYAYRYDGRRKLLALGSYPDVSLSEARRRHQETRKQLAQGSTPPQRKSRPGGKQAIHSGP
jgi:hypothetical protein